MGSLVNSGSATSYNGLSANGAITTLTNSGTFTGLNGIVSSAVTGTIRNPAGSLFEGTGNRGLDQDSIRRRSGQPFSVSWPFIQNSVKVS